MSCHLLLQQGGWCLPGLIKCTLQTELPCTGPCREVPLHSKPLPVHEAEVAVQVARIHSAFAELQLGLGVVVHVVHAHLLHDAKPALRHTHTWVGWGAAPGSSPQIFSPNFGRVGVQLGAARPTGAAGGAERGCEHRFPPPCYVHTRHHTHSAHLPTRPLRKDRLSGCNVWFTLKCRFPVIPPLYLASSLLTVPLTGSFIIFFCCLCKGITHAVKKTPLLFNYN